MKIRIVETTTGGMFTMDFSLGLLTNLAWMKKEYWIQQIHKGLAAPLELRSIQSI